MFLFGDDMLFLEWFVLWFRYIEVQVFVDVYGNVVYLGECECSFQWCYQKVIEEVLLLLFDLQICECIGVVVCNIVCCVDYVGVGMVEFIVFVQCFDEFFFMEMNIWLQVEYLVIEVIIGLDLVEWQLWVGVGEKLGFV